MPGPVIRVKVGDKVRIHLKNPAENKMSHSIDFHASQVAPNDEMRSIAPGEELLYEWTADYAGVWMYHCGTAPTLHHIANGMYGMVIVEPKEGLPKVDKEFALVQSEWYLGPQGDITNLDKASAGCTGPRLRRLQRRRQPVQRSPAQGRHRQARPDLRPRRRAEHRQLVPHRRHDLRHASRRKVSICVKGNEGNWGSQAIDLSPAQGAIVEFTTAEDGLYPFVTHAFNFVGAGRSACSRLATATPRIERQVGPSQPRNWSSRSSVVARSIDQPMARGARISIP